MKVSSQIKELYCSECLETHPIISYINGKPIVRCELPLNDRAIVSHSREYSDVAMSPTTRSSRERKDVYYSSRSNTLTSPTSQLTTVKERRFVVFH